MRSKALSFCALALIVALTGSACGGDDPVEDDVQAVEPSPTPTPEPVCPLTGEGPTEVALLNRPAVAVKIENSPQARPQAGLENADVVFEEVVEGGITRFLTVFHCSPISKAGPVRSARFDDPKIALGFTSVLAYSGANAIVERELIAQGLTILNEDTSAGALFRDPPGSYEVHSLYAQVADLLKIARKAKVEPPGDSIFTFGEQTDESRKARHITINFTASNTIEYLWEGGYWQRYEAGVPFVSEAGSQISVENVLIQQVDVNNSPHIRDVAGNPSPDIDLLKGGKAVLFRDGRAIKGTWTMPEIGEPPVFTTRAGDPMTFSPGAIWVELVPSGNGTVKGTFSFSKKSR